MKQTHIRANSNLAMLEFVANKLGSLNGEVIYVGGCSTALLINDPMSMDVRPTFDVDCIVDVISLIEYHNFERELRNIGFKQSMEDDVICRWRYDDMILDVVPTDEKILGFGNPWYKEAIDCAVIHKISDNLSVKSISAPYFLATKIEAFKGRGNNDLWGSHDFEDIITVVAGRVEIAEEVISSPKPLRERISSFLIDLLKNNQFEVVLPGHVNDGPFTEERVQAVNERIRKIIG